MALFGALSVFPDADAIAFKLGIPYAATFGHRGAVHSIGVAVGVALAVWIGARRSPDRLRLAALALGVLALHVSFDAMTDGGLGVAALWPASSARFFAPFRPIPVAPIGAGILSGRGFAVLRWELATFAPLWLYALWPRRRPLLRASAPGRGIAVSPRTRSS